MKKKSFWNKTSSEFTGGDAIKYMVAVYGVAAVCGIVYSYAIDNGSEIVGTIKRTAEKAKTFIANKITVKGEEEAE